MTKTITLTAFLSLRGTQIKSIFSQMNLTTIFKIKRKENKMAGYNNFSESNNMTEAKSVGCSRPFPDLALLKLSPLPTFEPVY